MFQFSCKTLKERFSSQQSLECGTPQQNKYHTTERVESLEKENKMKTVHIPECLNKEAQMPYTEAIYVVRVEIFILFHKLCLKVLLRFSFTF